MGLRKFNKYAHQTAGLVRDVQWVVEVEKGDTRIGGWSLPKVYIMDGSRHCESQARGVTEAVCDVTRGISTDGRQVGHAPRLLLSFRMQIAPIRPSFHSATKHSRPTKQAGVVSAPPRTLAAHLLATV